MAKTRSTLMQFSLFDSTALSGRTLAEPSTEDGPSILPPGPKKPVAGNYRLVGDRALAPTWKGRAADNLAAIRLLQQIEQEERPATAEEQARLAKFTGFGASELANTLFRRAGDAFRCGWEEMGSALERLVTPAELAGLARATQYAHYTPEFMIRAIWQALTRKAVDQHSPLPNQQIASLVQHQGALLVHGLHGDEAHGRPGDRLADRLGVGGVRLAALDVWFDIPAYQPIGPLLVDGPAGESRGGCDCAA